MPELPEVETSRRGIEPWIAGQTILQAEVRNARLRWPVDEEIIALRDRRVLSVQRRAKYLLLELDQDWIIIHFGMSGSLRVLPQPQPPESTIMSIWSSATAVSSAIPIRGVLAPGYGAIICSPAACWLIWGLNRSATSLTAVGCTRSRAINARRSSRS